MTVATTLILAVNAEISPLFGGSCHLCCYQEPNSPIMSSGLQGTAITELLDDADLPLVSVFFIALASTYLQAGSLTRSSPKLWRELACVWRRLGVMISLSTVEVSP